MVLEIRRPIPADGGNNEVERDPEDGGESEGGGSVEGREEEGEIARR